MLMEEGPKPSKKNILLAAPFPTSCYADLSVCAGGGSPGIAEKPRSSSSVPSAYSFGMCDASADNMG